MLSIINEDLFSITSAISSAALSYLPERLLNYTHNTKKDCCNYFCKNKPYALALLETQLGNILNIALPIFESDLYIDPSVTIRHIEEASQKAYSLGAKHIALTGLLPSAINFDFTPFLNKKLFPKIVTGHNITLIAIIYILEYCLRITNRVLPKETLGLLGLGSIGTKVITTMIQHLPHPKKIILCDLYKNQEKLKNIAESLKNQHGFNGEILITNSHAQVPDEFYEATFIIGASNIPEILDIRRLNQGTIIIDDSAPPTLSLSDAIKRFETFHDILYVEAGLLRSSTAIRQTISLPKGLDIPLFRKDEESHFEIAGCILSSLLENEEEKTFENQYYHLKNLGFTAPRLQFHGYFHEKTSHFNHFIQHYC